MRARFVAKDRRNLSIRRTAWVGVAAAATLILVLAMAGPAAAATATLSGRVTDGIGNPLGGSTIAVDTAGTTSQVAATTTGLDGSYSVSVEADSYDVHVTPPAASGFNPATFADFAISGETALDVVLTNAATATFKGVLQTSRGEPVSAEVYLNSESQSYRTLTDSSGAFSLAVPTGSYTLRLRPWGPGPIGLAWDISAPITISGDLTQNLTIPVVLVTAQVRDPSGNPVGSTAIRDEAGYQTDSFALWPGGPQTSTGAYGQAGETDGTGNVTFDLIPTSASNLTLTAVPPASNTSVGQTTLSNLSVTSDTTLRFNLPPVATFKGVLQTSRGEPVSAEVYLNSESQSYRTLTDSSGAFSLAVPTGSYTLRLRPWGPGPIGLAWDISAPITISGDLTQNLTIPVVLVTAKCGTRPGILWGPRRSVTKPGTRRTVLRCGPVGHKHPPAPMGRRARQTALAM